MAIEKAKINVENVKNGMSFAPAADATGTEPGSGAVQSGTPSTVQDPPLPSSEPNRTQQAAQQMMESNMNGAGKVGDVIYDSKTPKEQAGFDTAVKYGADWSKGFNVDTVRQSGKTITEANNAYKEYRKEHPEAPEVNFMDFYANFRNYDPTKTIADNEKEEKKAKKWDRIQGALSAFAQLFDESGNYAATPAAKVNDSKNWQNVQTMRQKDWQTLQAMYQQQKADEAKKISQANEAKRIALQESREEARHQEVVNALKQKSDKDKAAQDLAKDKLNHTIEKDKAEIGIKGKNATAHMISAQNAGKGKSGSGSRGGKGSRSYTEEKTSEYNIYGQPTTVRTKRTYETPENQHKTPPSRRKKK